MKSKVFLWSIIAVAVLGIAGGAYWWLRPQVIVLQDGTRLTLLSVTYGKKHSFTGTVHGHRVRGARTTTTNDALCLWIDQQHNKNYWPNFDLIAYDGAKTGCAGSSDTTQAEVGGRRNEEVVGVVFEAFPRHADRIYFAIQSWNPKNSRQEVSPKHFSVNNPSHRSSSPIWVPDNLPNTQQDGDLQVTLTRFEIETESGPQASPIEPMNKSIRTSFRIEQANVLMTNWDPVDITTMDATGNRAGNQSFNSSREGDEASLSYQWGLWPDEAAWKVRVEMSRSSGFNADELWSAQDLELKQGKRNDAFNMNDHKVKPAAETTLGATKVRIFPPVRFPSNNRKNTGDGMEGILEIHLEPAPEGYRMTLISITDDRGKPVEFNDWGSDDQDHRFSLKNLEGVKSLSLALALHRSRFVEFTVKPPKN